MGILDKIKKGKEAEETMNETAQDSSGKAEKKVKTSKKESGSKASRANAVLKYAHISEKTAHDETKGHYTFVVSANANKMEIAAAVEALYGVRPSKVRTVNTQGKNTAFGGRLGRRSDWKKAIVVLPAGKTINIHEGV